MAATGSVLGRSRVDTDAYEPLEIGGERHGHVHFIRNDDLDRGPYRAALWRLTEDDLPYESPYDFQCDETIHILQGELEMTLESGERLLLKEGDILSIAAGTRSDWRITKPFQKFVVET